MLERKMRNFLGHKFWARGYFVTTVGWLGGDPGLHQKLGTGRSAIGAVRAEDLSSPYNPNQSSKHPFKVPLAVPNQTSSFAGGYWLRELRLLRQPDANEVMMTRRLLP